MSAIKWLENQGFAVRSVEPLAGLTACSRKICLENGKIFVWREQSLRATKLGVDYAHEAALLSALSFLPFTPKCYFSAPEFSLLHWQDGVVPQAFHDTLLEKLATHLARLHSLDLQALNLPSSFTKLDLAVRCHDFWRALPPQKQARLDFLLPFEQIEPYHLAICHHDIHLGNLVEQGDELFLLDWEYAAISDSALDLACFLHGNLLTERQKSHFFEHYFAKFPQNRTACLAKIEDYLPMVAKLSQLWFAMKGDL